MASIALIAATFAALFMARPPGAVFLLVAMAAIADGTGYYLGRCPACGKPARKFYLTGNEKAWGGLLYLRRWWPERECSSCRTPLDVI
jgi:hypothetical protein